VNVLEGCMMRIVSYILLVMSYTF